MNEIPYEKFEMNVESIMRAAASGDHFTTVQMNSGKAVIISKEEWDILCEAFARLIGGQILK